MTCTICGGEFILGTDRHAQCREIEKLREQRDQILEEMISWWISNHQKIERIIETGLYERE